jgi:uncharacterized membrane protein
MHRVHVEQDFARPVSEVFEHLAEHENLEPLFGAKIKRVKDGDDGNRNGVGSVRELRVGPPFAPTFDETVTEYTPDELIRYRITRGGVIKNHEGVMRFSSRPGGGSHLDYVITFDGKLPLIGTLVQLALGRSVSAGLKKLA